MSEKDEMVLVWWIKEHRTSIVKLSDVNEEDRYTGCVSQVKFGKQAFPARILKISSSQVVLKIAEDEFFKEMDNNLKSKNDSKKRIMKPKKSFGSVASEHEVAVAIGEKYNLPPKLHAMKRNEIKNAKENLKYHNQAQVEFDNLLFAKNKSKDVVDRKKNNCPVNNVKTIKTRPKMSASQAISQTDFMEKLNEDDSMSESSSVENINESSNEEDDNAYEGIDDIDHKDDIDHEDDHHKDTEVSDEKKIKGKEKEGVSYKHSWSSNNLGGITFLEQYRGNLLCINMLRDIITYLGGGSAEKKINDSHDVSQSMYIDLLPIPPEHAKSSLQKGSGVHITKAAQSRIILEAAAACHQNVSGKRKRKADALLGPKTMIRHALIEMFGRAQLAEASACGSHGKKAIRKHILQALYHFVTQNSVGCNLSWSQFIDTINRKCEQISRHKKQKLEPQCSDISIDQEAVTKLVKKLITNKKTNERCQSTLRPPSAHQQPLQDIQCISMNKIPAKSLSVDSNTSPLHPVVQTSSPGTKSNNQEAHSTSVDSTLHELSSTKHVSYSNVESNQQLQPACNSVPFVPSLPLQSYNYNSSNSYNNSSIYNYPGTIPIPSDQLEQLNNNQRTDNSFFTNFSSNYAATVDYSNYISVPSSTYQSL